MAGPCRGHDVVIRERKPADDEAIRRLNDAAFGGPIESKIVEALRLSRLAAVELVAVEADEIVGHILFSALKVTFGEELMPTLALAPMAVSPAHQRRGIGSELVQSGLALARQREWWAVIVLGHPDYYPRFGFSAALARPLAAPYSGEAFMALELVPGALSGTGGKVVYPAAFEIDA
ncbi:MAG: N-acetyltransferase [Alphaproteobacteria bacterium]|jgi:putative acetyltransferase|nr:N-acetyltransferase [Alphaproteobacteria bacterium]